MKRSSQFKLHRRPTFGRRGFFALERGQTAFTLLELLVVMAILTLMTTLMAPAIQTILGGRGIDYGANSISGAMEEAQSFAKSGNTYVWVGVRNVVNDRGNAEVRIGMAKSLDGTANYAAGNMAPVGKVLRLENMKMTEIDDIVAPRLRNLFADEETGVSLLKIKSPVVFQIGGDKFADSVMTITPQGQVVAASTLDASTPVVSVVGFAVQPTKGDVIPPGTQDGFGMLIAGQTGKQRMLRVE